MDSIKYTRDDVTGIIYLSRKNLMMKPRQVLVLFEEFQNSEFNAPEKPIINCIDEWVSYRARLSRP